MLAAHIKCLQDTVQEDIKKVEEHLQAASAPTLKRKFVPIADENIKVEKKPCQPQIPVKQEQGIIVKAEPHDPPPVPTVRRTMAPSNVELLMDKQELMKLHGISKVEDGSTKKYPLECVHCSKQFSAKNRAKLWQHVAGAAHRQKWKGAEVQSESALKEPAGGSTAEGKCEGLQLSSTLGQQTRLGSDLAMVWKVYTAFANLEWAEGVGGQQCHQILHDCNLDCWVLRSANCKQHCKVPCFI